MSFPPAYLCLPAAHTWLSQTPVPRARWSPFFWLSREQLFFQVYSLFSGSDLKPVSNQLKGAFKCLLKQVHLVFICSWKSKVLFIFLWYFNKKNNKDICTAYLTGKKWLPVVCWSSPALRQLFSLVVTKVCASCRCRHFLCDRWCLVKRDCWA